MFFLSSMACLGPPGVAQESEYWAFRSLEPIKIPAKGSQWARNSIDHFVLAGAREKGIAPNAPADRQRLIRRVYFDLTGLAPTRTEAADFVASKSPDAYAEMITQLLASPHYGERWKRRH